MKIRKLCPFEISSKNGEAYDDLIKRLNILEIRVLVGSNISALSDHTIETRLHSIFSVATSFDELENALFECWDKMNQRQTVMQLFFSCKAK